MTPPRATGSAEEEGAGGGGQVWRTVREVHAASHTTSGSNPDPNTPVPTVYTALTLYLALHTSTCLMPSQLQPSYPPTNRPPPGAAPSQQSTWLSTVPLWLPALLATPEWSTEDCFGDGGDGGDGDGMGGEEGGGCGSISEFRRQRRLERDRMYRDAIGSTLSTFSQVTRSHV